MNTPLLLVGTVFAILAALVHVVIFTFESVNWTKPAVWKRFGLSSQQDADTVRPMAYNQGFYNLFLAIGTVVGLLLMLNPDTMQAGYGVALFATLSMLAAASVLIISNPKLARAAVTQGAFPLVAVVFLLLAQVV
jgi:putative membrane protein